MSYLHCTFSLDSDSFATRHIMPTRYKWNFHYFNLYFNCLYLYCKKKKYFFQILYLIKLDFVILYRNQFI